MKAGNTKLAAVATVAVMLCLVLSYTVYDGSDDDGRSPTWLYSNLVGNLPEDVPDARDDLYLNTNHGWLSQHQDVAVADSALIRMGQVPSAMIRGQGLDVSDPNARVYLEFLRAYMDTALRDSATAEDLVPYLGDLMAAEDLDDLTAYLTGGGCVLSPPFLQASTLGLEQISPVNEVYVAAVPFTMSAQEYAAGGYAEGFEEAETYYSRLLQLMGYTAAEAEAMNDAATAVELVILEGTSPAVVASIADVYDPVPVEELSRNAFPIAAILESMGYRAEGYTILDPIWLETMDGVYAPENFEGLRAMLLRNSLVTAAQFMGGEFFAAFQGISGMDLGTSFNTMVNGSTAISSLLNTIHTGMYADDEAASVVTGLFAELKDAFADRIGASDWMDAPTKAAALEKLDAMVIRVGGPDTVDFGSLDGRMPGDPLGMYLALAEVNDGHSASIAGQPVDGGYWPLQSYSVNAMNAWSVNTVYVTWAFLQDGYYYSSDGDREELLGCLGFTIGHEITHGFDTIGRAYGPDGTAREWWSPESDRAFDEMADRVSDYISGVTLLPDRTMDPDIVISEVIADMGGMALILDLAVEEGLDIGKMVRDYASLWATAVTPAYDEMIMNDPHPPDAARVNMTLQQFQRFHDVFGVTEGDGMWLAPEDRVAVW